MEENVKGPERVWLNPYSVIVCDHSLNREQGDIEYIRADLLTATSDSARRAADGIADYVSDGILGMGNEVTETDRAKFLEVINRAFAAAPADNDAESLLQHVAYIRERRDYFAAKDLHNGWSGRESGHCCGRCILLPEHFTGRADALRALAGCRNPFQLPDVCQCHIPVREAVRAGIIEAHDQLLRKLEVSVTTTKGDR